MVHDASPTARALLALETIENLPGITSQRLGERLGVTERSARRYVAILREAGLPVESVTGPNGGYRVGRGLRLPPLMFTAAEAIGLVMAVLEGHQMAADPTDLVGGALAKIARVLPQRLAEPVLGYRDAAVPPRHPGSADPEMTARLLEGCSAGHRLRVGYDTGRSAPRCMEVDPWAVLLRHGYWYLLCWSHTAGALRVLRVDRVVSIESMAETFSPPEGLDGRRTLEDHLSRGWRYEVEVLVDAPLEACRRFLPRSMANFEPHGEERTRLRATTEDPPWYARQLAALPVPWHVVASEELREAVDRLAHQLSQAARRQQW